MKNYGRIIKSLVVVYLVIMLTPSSALANELTPPTVEDGIKSVLDTPVVREDLIDSLEDITDGEVTELDPLTNHILESCPDLTQGELTAINSMFSKQLNTPDGTDKFQFYINYLDNSSEVLVEGMTAHELYQRSPYYQDVYHHFEQIIKDYGHMNSDAKLEFLLTETPSMENTIRIFDEANDEKKTYIVENTSSNVEEINALSEELGSKSTTYLIGHPKWVQKQSDEIEEAEEDYHHAVALADKKYDMDNPSTLEKIGNGITQYTNKVWGSYDPDAYVNAMAVKNELAKVQRQPGIKNAFIDNNHNKPDIKLGELVQYKMESSNPNQPMYKYYLIKNESGYIGPPYWMINELVLTGKNRTGGNITDESKAGDMVSISITGDRWKVIPKDSLNPENTPYAIYGLNGTLRNDSVGDLYTAYSVDPTGLNSRLSNVPTAGDSSDLIDGIVMIVAGISMVVIGAVLIYAGVCAEAITGGVATVAIITGLGILVGGIVPISTGSIKCNNYRTSNNNHKNTKKAIYNDIKKHNQYPEPMS
jgi:hypothetical protein